ncbi:MAG: PAS domain S-box protein [Bacilli bacterium]|nr:PAS domain S-box protein [Bacilli bacterium]MBN2696714.1 PAS domain S-box protein [Bacilli bacterium]
MKKYLPSITTGFVLLVLTGLTIWQSFEADLHSSVVHIYYITVIFIAFWMRKWLLWATGYIVLMHMALDAITTQSFPLFAFGESVLLIMLALFLHYTFVNQEKSETIAKLFKQVADDSIFAQIITDTDGKIVYVNPYFAGLNRVEPEKMIGQDLASLIEVTHDTKFKDMIESLRQTGFFTETELCLSDNGKELPMLASGVVINDTENKPEFYAICAIDITDQKQLSNDLKKNKDRLESIIEATRIGTWEWDIESGKTIFDDRWADMAGYTLEELSPTTIDTWNNLLHPDDKEIVETSLARIFAQKEEYYNVIVRMKHKNGNFIWVHDRGKVIKWSDTEKPLLMMGTHTDVTEAKLAEEQIKYSHRLMQYVIENANAAIAIHDKDLKYLYVSQNYLRQYDVKEKNIIGKHHYDVFPDLPQKWRDVHQRTLKGETVRGDKDIFVRSDGKEFWTRWESRPWYELDGSIGGLIIYTEVINERLETEKRLQESQDMLLRVMDNLPIGIALAKLDPEYTFTYMNENFPVFYGAPRKDLEKPGFFWNAVFEDPKYREAVRKTFEQDVNSSAASSKHWKRIPIARKGKKTRYVDAVVTSMMNGEYFISMVNDVTEQVEKQTEIERISMHDSLTGLFNRNVFTSRLTELDEVMNYPLSIMMIDINGLKLINDAFGFQKGDQAIKMIAEAIKKVLENKNSVIARLGGGEFGAILSGTNFEEAQKVKDAIIASITKLKLSNMELGVVIGVATKLNDEISIQELLKNAEDDMLKRKILVGRGIRNSAITSIFKTLTEKYEEEKLHSQRVSIFCRQIGEAMQLSRDDVKELELAGLFHDIGKISLRDDVLKKPGKLTDEEYAEVKKHAEIGYQILRAADKYSGLAEHALCHHERWDGKGYPNGLKGEEIPFFSRIICVADAFEAMTSDRPYRKANKLEFAAEELKRCAGTQFDATIVDVFVNKVLKLPPKLD